jgi:hypothetical protein
MNTIHLKHDSSNLDGADNDGRIAASRIQAALDRAHADGGGRVALGAGEWLCTTIVLRSSVELHLELGSRLVADTDMTHYTPTPQDRRRHPQPTSALLVGSDCHDVVLSGGGIVDGSAMAFMEPCEGEDDRPHGIFRFKHKKPSPSHFILFANSRNIVIDGLTIMNSPTWTLHLFDCDNVQVRNVTIRNNPLAPYNDGIVIDASRDVHVSDCDVDTGDDAIIVKATDPALACERVTVTNCVAASNCSTFGLGADAPGTIRDVEFSNCKATRSLRMIQVEQWYPGLIERAVFRDINGRTFPDEGIFCERPIYVDIQQWSRKEPELGMIRDLVFENIQCETRGRIILTAQDGSCIENVILDNIQIRIPEIEDPAETVPTARSKQLSNFSPVTRAVRAAVVADNVKGLQLRDVKVDWPDNPEVPMHALCVRRCDDMRLASPSLTASSHDVAFTVTQE